MGAATKGSRGDVDRHSPRRRVEGGAEEAAKEATLTVRAARTTKILMAGMLLGLDGGGGGVACGCGVGRMGK